MSRPERTYGGRTAEQRQAERRERLIEAAIDIWGTQGWAAVTMRGVCAKAGLIDRYFYESFTDRDALLAAVWDEIQNETLTTLSQAFFAGGERPVAEQLRAGITALVQSLTADPVRAHIGLGDHAGSAVLQHRRRELVLLVSDLIIAVCTPQVRPDADPEDLRIWALVGIGGTYELVSAWHAGVLAVSPEQLIEQASQLGAVLVEHFLPR